MQYAMTIRNIFGIGITNFKILGYFIKLILPVAPFHDNNISLSIIT